MSGIIIGVKAVMGSLGIAISISSLVEAISMGVVFGAMVVLISLAIPESTKKDDAIKDWVDFDFFPRPMLIPAALV